MTERKSEKTLKKPIRKKAETNSDLLSFVEDLKRQWVATIDALIDPLMIVSKDFTVTKANKAMAKHADKEVKEIVGQKCYQVFANKKKPCDGCKMLEAGRTQKPKHFNLENIDGDNFFEVTSQPLLEDKKGSKHEVVQLYRDRSDAIQLQAQLLQNEKLASIGLLAGGIAHEINNPLGGILIFSQMLLRELAKDSPHYQDVREIEAAALRCKSIVEGLLAFSRTQPQNEKKKKILEKVDVTSAAQAALRFAKIQEHARKIDITEDWQLASGMIRGDNNALIQLFLNLIQNAFQAMPKGGTLKLRSRKEKRDKIFWGIWDVEDSGVGIPKTNLKKIFDPFFTTKETGKGTGLGLSISYGICLEFGGHLEVFSEPKHGACFSISFPLL